MRNAIVAGVLFLAGGCMAATGAATGAATADDGDGCPVGEQPVFGPDADLICAPVPHWPPAQTGSRAVAAGCELRDGAYHLTWHPDVVDPVRPAFSVTKLLTIEGDAMALDEYSYRLDWIDSAEANVWEPGDSDTLEFWIALDCASGELRGAYTVTVPYYSPGHQTQTWTLTGTL